MTDDKCKDRGRTAGLEDMLGYKQRRVGFAPWVLEEASTASPVDEIFAQQERRLANILALPDECDVEPM